MDIHQIRGWADFLDKAMIIGIIVTAIAIIATGTTAWFVNQVQ